MHIRTFFILILSFFACKASASYKDLCGNDANVCDALRELVGEEIFYAGYYNDPDHLDFDDSDPIQGKKAAVVFLRSGCKELWNLIRKNQLNNSPMVPDGDMRFRVTNELNYKVNVKSEDVTLEFNYTF